jgi:Tfp pilus assembly protein PilP
MPFLHTLYYQMPNWQPASSGNNKLTNPSPKRIHTMLEEFIISLFRLVGEQVSGQKRFVQLQVS